MENNATVSQTVKVSLTDAKNFTSVAFNAENNEFKKIIQFNLNDQEVIASDVRILLRGSDMILSMYLFFLLSSMSACNFENFAMQVRS